MATINRQELDQLERRELQLTIVAAVFVFVLASGLAVFMYPMVFVHPDNANKWTLRVAFFGFCALTLLFIGYLLERQRTIRKLKAQILEELERNIELRLQASADLLHTMPDINHFWDRLTMEYRRAMTMQRNLSLLVVKAKLGASADGDNTSALGDAAKAMSRKLRPSDSIYRLAPEIFGLVLPETDTLNAKRIAVRLQEELQTVRAKLPRARRHSEVLASGKGRLHRPRPGLHASPGQGLRLGTCSSGPSFGPEAFLRLMRLLDFCFLKSLEGETKRAPAANQR
jgi:GGDEF domain-containing protein